MNTCYFLLLLIFLPHSYSFLSKFHATSLPSKDSIPCLNKLTQDEKDQILKMHNFLRNQIASGLVEGFNASRHMNELVWDSELENLAQNYANTNPNFRNTNRSIPSHPQDHIGENLYFMKGGVSYYNISKTVEFWYNESLHFTGNLSNFTVEIKDGEKGDKIGEFTQVFCLCPQNLN